jgi:uncharacterized membrane protein YidH (DUF202 family)
MIVGGGLIAIVGAWRFVRTEHQIDAHDYHPALLAHLVLAAAITFGAVAIGMYLLLPH